MDVVKTILNKGLDQDHSPEEQPQGTYRFAENLINNSTESINELAVEPAVVQKLALESNEVLVGDVTIVTGKQSIIKTICGYSILKF